MAEQIIVAFAQPDGPRAKEETVIRPFVPNNHYIQYAPCISPVDSSLCIAKDTFTSAASFSAGDWNVAAVLGGSSAAGTAAGMALVFGG